MDDRNWLSKCIFIFCTIVNIQNAASFPHVPNSQEDYLMSVVSGPKGRKHAPSAPLMDERYPSYYTPMAPKQPDRSNHGKPRTHRPIGFTSRTIEGQHEKSRKGTLKLHSTRLSRTKKPRPTWPNLAKKRTTISTEKHEPDPHIEHTTPLAISHIEHTTPLAISHALGGGYPDQTGMYQQQGLGGAYNQMGQSGQPNTGTALLQNILGGNSGNCAPGGYCPQGGGNPFGGLGGGFGNNGLGGGFGNNGFGGGFGGGLGNNGFGGGFGNNGLGGGLGNLFRQGSTTTQSTTTSTTKDPLDLSFNFPSNDNSSDLSSLGSFGDYGLSNATSSSDDGLSLDDSSNSTSATDGNSTSATNSNSTSETNSNSTSATNSNSTSATNSNSTSTTNSNSTSPVDGSGKVSATNSSNGTSNTSNSSTISTSSSDPKDETTSTTDSLGFDSFNYNYESSDSSSSFENSGLSNAYEDSGLSNAYEDSGLSNAYEDSGLSNAYEDKDLSIDYEDKDLGNDNVNRK